MRFRRGAGTGKLAGTMFCSEKTYAAEDLRALRREEPSFAVLGKPIAHSLSPKMHNAAFDAMRERLPADGRRYFRFEIAPEELAETLPLFFEKNFLGLNLTIPHKVAALPLLKEISSEAETAGAANTLVRDDARGGWRGENTDGRGFVRAAETRLRRKLAGTPVVLLGAGGAARAIAAAALEAGCASLAVVNRSRERGESLARRLRIRFPDTEISFRGEFSPAEKNAFPDGALVVNATPLGLKPGDPPPLPPELLPPDAAVYDATYGAHGASALVAAARERGMPADDGRAMLAWQGALAFELWNGVPADDVFPVMFSALQ